MSYLGPSCIRWHIYMSWSKISNGSVMRVVFTQTKSFHRQLSWNTYSHTETYLLNYDIYICHPYMGTLRDYSVRMTYIYVKSFFAPIHLIDMDRYFYTKMKSSWDEIRWPIYMSSVCRANLTLTTTAVRLTYMYVTYFGPCVINYLYNIVYISKTSA